VTPLVAYAFFFIALLGAVITLFYLARRNR